MIAIARSSTVRRFAAPGESCALPVAGSRAVNIAGAKESIEPTTRRLRTSAHARVQACLQRRTTTTLSERRSALRIRAVNGRAVAPTWTLIK
jgi:hypothetical protein